MMSLESLLLSDAATIREAIAVIDAGERRTALIVDAHFKLIGIIRDADVRHGLLAGLELETPAARVMNTQPVVSYPSMSRHNLVDYMRARRRDMLPIVDAASRLVGVEFLVDTIRAEMQPNEVVVMAGGFGHRLGALTRDCPKPLLNVGSRPILETIIESFAEQGFRRFWIAVNYLASRIEAYFGDGRHWGVEIEDLREEMPLGTAGALSLLPRPPTHPLIVMNGDLLTKVRFDELITFHREARARATMCIRRHEVTIPYGVVEAADGYLSGMIEKPRQNCFINAGIYVLEPELIAVLAHRTPRTRPYRGNAWCLATTPCGRFRLRLDVELPPMAPELLGCCQDHRHSPLLAIIKSVPEVRALCSAGITRPHSSYGPVRRPRGPSPKVTLRARPSSPPGLPRLPVSLFQRAVPSTPADQDGCTCRLLPRPARPSPDHRRVGIRDFTFEACSGFTRITARWIAQPPKAAFVAGLRSIRLPGQTACQLPDQTDNCLGGSFLH